MTSEGDGLDQTQYLVRSRLYDDPATPPEPLDLHSAAAIGNYECVQEAINSGQDIDARNKGVRGRGVISRCIQSLYSSFAV